MHLPPDTIKEFQKIYQEEFGEKLDDEEAYKRAMRILQVFSILCRKEKRISNGKNPSLDNIPVSDKIEDR